MVLSFIVRVTDHQMHSRTMRYFQHKLIRTQCQLHAWLALWFCKWLGFLNLWENGFQVSPYLLHHRLACFQPVIHATI